MELYFVGAYSNGLIRRNMTVLQSVDEGITWIPYRTIDQGAVAYSALQIIPSLSTTTTTADAEPAFANGSGSGAVGGTVGSTVLGLLYERSDNISIVFAPDQILFVPISLY